MFLEGFFYEAAATAGAGLACCLSLLPLLSHYRALLQQKKGSSSSSSSSGKLAAAGIRAQQQQQPEPLTLACRIMLMVPVYALTSLLAFLFCSPFNSLPSSGVSAAAAAAAGQTPGGSAAAAAAAAAAALQQGSGGWKGLWLRGIREAYEVYALYAFLELMISMLGGEQQAVNQLHLKGTLQHLWPLNHFLPSMECDRSLLWLGRIKSLAGQFVFVKPAAFVVNACMQQEGFLLTAVISNISAFIAVYALILFYMAVRRPLAPKRPLPKFLCLKAVVFLSFWQSLVLRWLAGLFLSSSGPAAAAAAAAAAARLQDWLICFEMIPCAVANMWAFRTADFSGVYTPQPISCLASSSQTADECSLLLQRASASSLPPLPAAAAKAGLPVDNELSSSSSSSSSSNLKKPLKKLMSGVQHLLLSDAVLTDATHAVFGSQQQQREFCLETRSQPASPQQH
ncbi:hypothetical protein Efla_004712 [Eimeria flavescens]